MARVIEVSVGGEVEGTEIGYLFPTNGFKKYYGLEKVNQPGIFCCFRVNSPRKVTGKDVESASVFAWNTKCPAKVLFDGTKLTFDFCEWTDVPTCGLFNYETEEEANEYNITIFRKSRIPGQTDDEDEDEDEDDEDDYYTIELEFHGRKVDCVVMKNNDREGLKEGGVYEIVEDEDGDKVPGRHLGFMRKDGKFYELSKKNLSR